MNLRVTFRTLIGITLAIMMIMRWSGGHMTAGTYRVFYNWFRISIFLFGAFGLWSAWNAFRDAPNRRAYLTDIVLAAAWVPYWFANFR